MSRRRSGAVLVETWWTQGETRRLKGQAEKTCLAESTLKKQREGNCSEENTLNAKNCNNNKSGE